jgi:small ligand-binding sensory domain FIST
MFVTRCRDNVLYEVDGRAPLELLQELYERADRREQALLQSGLFAGIQMRSDPTGEYGVGDFLVRNLVGMDRESGALEVAAPLHEGQVLQFQLRDARSAAADLEARLRHYAEGKSGTPEGALLFSCLGRGRGLYGIPDHDSDLFRRLVGELPLAGFFGNGEIGPVENETFLHSYTSAFGIFRSLSH